MIPVSPELRARLRAETIRPEVEIVFHGLFPKWEVVGSMAAGYVEFPDVRGGSALHNSAGEFQYTLNGWANPVAADAVAVGNSVLKILAPAGFGVENPNFHLFVFGSQVNAEQATQPLQTITVPSTQRQRSRTRGGLIAVAETAEYYYIRNDGAINKLTGGITGAWSTTPTLVWNTTRYGVIQAGAVAPVGVNTYFVLYTENLRIYYLDFIQNNALVLDRIPIAYCYDDKPHWAPLTYFDAELYQGRYILIVNSSRYGNSMSYQYSPGANLLSDPIPILPTSDMDWNSLLRVSGLSIINQRLYALAWQRFVQSDETFSQEITSVIWTNDGQHWAQAPHLVVGTTPVAGKVLAGGDSVLVVGNAITMRGRRTIDFGGSGDNVRVLTPGVIRWSVDRMSDGSGAAIQVTCKRTPFYMDISQMRDYMDLLIIKLGASGLRDADPAIPPETIATGYVFEYDHKMAASNKQINITARGPLARLGEYRQFVDDYSRQPLAIHADMDQANVVQLANSIWGIVNGELVNLYPNRLDQSLVVLPDRLRGNHFLRYRLTYEPGVRAFGFVLWAGVSRNKRRQALLERDEQGQAVYSPEDLVAHNYVLLRFTPIPGGGVSIALVRVQGHKVKGEWVEFHETLATYPNIPTWLPSTYLNWYIQYTYGVLRLWWRTDAGDVWNLLDTRTINFIPPEEWQTGIWVYSYQATLTESVLPGKNSLPVSGAEEWPMTGLVEIHGQSHTYTLSADRKTMTISPNLQQFAGEGTILVRPDSKVRVDFMQAIERGQRHTVGEVCRHIAMRSGIAMRADNLAPEANWTAVGKSMESNGWLLDEIPVTSPIALGDHGGEYFLSGLTAGRWVEWLPWTSADYSPWRLRLTINPNILSIYQQNTLMGSIPLPPLPTDAWYGVIWHEGWVHFYVNKQHLGSLYHGGLKRGFGQIALRGGGQVRLRYVRILAGCEMVYLGLWDGQTPAREAILDAIQGLPLQIVENADNTVSLINIMHTPHIGVLPVSLLPQIGHVRYKGVASALVLQGGYDWLVEFAPDLFHHVGLNWTRQDNDKLLSRGALQYHAGQILQRWRGEVDRYTFTGRYDPAMQLFDRFTTTSFANYPGASYMIVNLTITHDVATASLQCEGIAVGVPR